MVNGVKTFLNVKFNYPATMMKLYANLVKSTMTAFIGTKSMGKIEKHRFIDSRESSVLSSLDNFVAWRTNALMAFFLRVVIFKRNSFHGLKTICSFLKLIGNIVKLSHVNGVQSFFSFAESILWNSRSSICWVAFHFFVSVNLTIAICVIIYKMIKNPLRVLFT